MAEERCLRTRKLDFKTQKIQQNSDKIHFFDDVRFFACTPFRGLLDFVMFHNQISSVSKQRSLS